MGHARGARSIDKLAADQLRRMLSASSARVFHCDRLNKEVKALKPKPSLLLFRKEGLSNIIYIKEPYPDGPLRDEAAFPVGTKLYFAYNQKDAFEGGRSIFFRDPTLRSALHFHAGIDPHDSGDEVRHDLNVLQLLDDLPSLDPFLLKDRMQSEGLEAHPHYFEISEEEFGKIRDFVMVRFRPMVEFAFEGMSQTSAATHLRTLVQKLWEAKDMEGLSPIVKALNLQAEEAPGIFYAWKGVIYYDYLFATQQERWKEYATWMAQQSTPSDVVPKQNRQEMDAATEEVRRLLKVRWQKVRQILDDYHNAYNTLFFDRKSPAPFLEFMKGARRKFYELGDGISRVDHAIEIWRGLRQSKVFVRLKYDQLQTLMELTHRLLS
jgi:hypothetical protein